MLSIAFRAMLLTIRWPTQAPEPPNGLFRTFGDSSKTV